MRALIGLCICLCVFGGYSISGFDNETLSRGNQSLATQTPVNQTDVPKAYRQHSVVRNSDGHFYIDAIVEGRPLEFLVDTGASSILLSQSDAQALGHFLPKKAFTYEFKTANGVTFAAKTTLDQMRIGRRDFKNVEAFILPQGLDISLLGQSVLARFETVEMQKNALKLTW